MGMNFKKTLLTKKKSAWYMGLALRNSGLAWKYDENMKKEG